MDWLFEVLKLFLLHKWISLKIKVLFVALKFIIFGSHVNSPTKFITLRFVVDFINRDIVFFAPEMLQLLQAVLIGTVD